VRSKGTAGQEQLCSDPLHKFPRPHHSTEGRYVPHNSSRGTRICEPVAAVGNHAGKMSYGCTCIVRPDGLIVSRAAERTEEVIVFDLA
jgi:hypothetical protein